MDKKKTIETLQFFVTGLTEGALVHKMQGQLFKSQGLGKLGDKYINHLPRRWNGLKNSLTASLTLAAK